MKHLDKIAWRLIDRGSFNLNSDKEFNELPSNEQDIVRRHVRFELLMNE
jgi:hypothetical protein